MASIINSTTTAGVTVTGDNSGSLQLATNNGTTALTIDTSQNVGVGTTTPTGKFEVKSANNTGTDSIIRATSNNGTASTWLTFNGVSVSSGNACVFYNGTTEQARISSAGDLLIGETGGTSKLSITQSSNSSTAMRIVYSGTGAFPIEAITSNASYTGAGIRSRVQNLAAGSGYYAFSYYNDNAADYRFYVRGDGNVYNTTGTYGTLSDAKLKENITDATSKLDKVNQLKVKNYNFIGEELNQIGFVAQEFEQVFPSLVDENIDRDEQGKDLGTTTKTIKTSVLIPILVKAIQELKAELDATKAEVQALKGVA